MEKVFGFVICLVILTEVIAPPPEVLGRSPCSYLARIKRQLGWPCRHDQMCCEHMLPPRPLKDDCGGCAGKIPSNQPACYKQQTYVCGSTCGLQLGVCTSITRTCYKSVGFCCTGFKLVGTRCIC